MPLMALRVEKAKKIFEPNKEVSFINFYQFNDK